VPEPEEGGRGEGEGEGEEEGKGEGLVGGLELVEPFWAWYGSHSRGRRRSWSEVIRWCIEREEGVRQEGRGR